MTALEIALFASAIVLVSVGSAVVSFLSMRNKYERERQANFESKLREMLTERNRHLSKLVESLLFESIDMLREEISESDYKESVSQAANIIKETNRAISTMESDRTPASIAGMTILQKKLQDMVDNLDEQIVAREELNQDSRDYKTLN
jgi:hypothetical protein